MDLKYTNELINSYIWYTHHSVMLCTTIPMEEHVFLGYHTNYSDSTSLHHLCRSYVLP